MLGLPAATTANCDLIVFILRSTCSDEALALSGKRDYRLPIEGFCFARTPDATTLLVKHAHCSKWIGPE